MKKALIAALALAMGAGFYSFSSFTKKENDRAEKQRRDSLTRVDSLLSRPNPSTADSAESRESRNPKNNPVKSVLPQERADGRMFLPRFSDHFYFPTKLEREAHIQTVFERMKTPLQASKYWLGRTVIVVQGKRIPITLIVTLYDAHERRSADPLRSISQPEHLAWLVVGYFDVDGDLIKKTMSSLIENIAKRDKNYYLYLMSSDTGSLQSYFEYIALPVPGSRGIAAEVLEAGAQKKWKPLPGFAWAPVNEAGYRDLMEEVDRASHY